MIQLEQITDYTQELIDFGDLDQKFHINAAFHGAIFGVATDQELAQDEKIRRMEFITTEMNSEVYRGFIDFRSMAAALEMICSHDHGLDQATRESNILSSFRGHIEEEDDDDDEASHKKAKRKKKKTK